MARTHDLDSRRRVMFAATLAVSLLFACTDRGFVNDVPRSPGPDVPGDPGTQAPPGPDGNRDPVAPQPPPGEPGGGVNAVTGAVLALRLDEGAGSVATDRSGNDNHGALRNGATWGQGGLVLDGSDDYIEIPDDASLDQTTALTVAAWIKIDDFDNWDGIVSKGTNSLSYTFNLTSAGRLRFRAQPTSGSSDDWDSSASLALGRWHHVAVTWDGSEVNFFIDGVRDSNRPNASFTLRTNNEPFVIGADIPGSATQYLQGAIRDVYVYDTALAPTEVTTLADALAPKAIGAFLGGNLPSTTPGGATGYTIAPAFPNLTFDDPLVIRPAPNSTRLYVGSRQGYIESFVNTPNASTKIPFLDLTDTCAEVWDGGFLGLAFHPEFGQAGSPNRGYVYVYYCWSADDDYPRTYGESNGFFDCYLRLSRFTVPDGSLAADRNSEDVMIHLRLYNGSHRSGDIAFGPDGFLYVPIGDQFRYETAQELDDNLEGGIARIDVDRDPARSHAPRRTMPLAHPEEISGQFYWIPNTNPFLDPGGSIFEEWYSIGHRNPHRMTIDALTGRIWSGEIGGGKREEINVIERGGNYGWPFREGLTTGPRSQPPSFYGTLTDPVLDFQRSEANAIIGGYVYRGSQFPGLYGKYLCVGHRQHRLWALTYDPASRTATKELLTTFSPTLATTFGYDHTGELYIGSLHKNDTLYKLVPQGSSGQPPFLLSQTGAFTDVATLTPAAGVVPYELNAPFWSDNAIKRRWIAIPNDGAHDTAAETIQFAPRDNWTFPEGTVLIKHFELAIDERDPARTRRLETRLLVLGDDGVFYGATYRWRPDGSDAELLSTGMEEDVTIATATGGSRVQTWTYPSRIDCLNCHQQGSGGVLGPRTHQLNGPLTYPDGSTENQLRAWHRLGWFRTPLDTAAIADLPRAVRFDDLTAGLETRARSYVDSNCASCHRPETGNRAQFDARLTTPLYGQGLIGGTVLEDLGITGAKLIAPGDADRSIAWHRLAALDATAMPPLAKNVAHEPGVTLVRQWIQGLDPDVTAWTLGHPLADLPSIDGWWHNMLVDEDSTYTNETGAVQTVRVASFRFFAKQFRGDVTPFVVKVLGDDSFTVVAIGTPRSEGEYALGPNAFSFVDGGEALITLQPGEILAPGFLDARPDGSGGEDDGIVAYCTCDGDNEIWYTGGPNSGDSGSVTLGAPPTPGASVRTDFNRIYAFAIDFCECAPPARVSIGNGLGDQHNLDGWRSNLVINETDTHTNDTGAAQQIEIETFAFHARSLGDPVTPFVVRINANDDFTVLAIGATRTALDYAVGDNHFSFAADGPVPLTLAPGETIATGFLDAHADGTGGGSAAVIPFGTGGDEVWHSGGPDGADSGSVAVGNPPQTGTSGGVGQTRSYAFAIRMRQGPPGTATALGHTATDRPQLDPWAAQVIVSRSGSHTNAGPTAQHVDVRAFRFWAAAAGGPLTPFVVKVRGPRDFQVLALGTTREDYAAGENVVPFLEGGPIELVLEPGETLAAGFASARADGSGAAPAMIPFREGGEVWLTGGPAASDAGRLEYGLPPFVGTYTAPGERSGSGSGVDSVPVSVLREYGFAIDLRVR